MSRTAPLSPTLVWAALAVAFSPALADLASAAADVPANATIVFAAALSAVAALRDRAAGPARPGAGIALLAAAALLEIVGILGGTAFATRASVPVAIVGGAHLLGRPSLVTALLTAWLVPIPVGLLEIVRVPLEHGAAEVVAASARALSVGAEAVGPIVRTGNGTLETTSRHAGTHLAHLLALVGWFAAAVRHESLARAVRRAGLGALLAFPVQLAALALAGALLHSSGPETALGLLDQIVPGVSLILGVAWAERGRARAPRAAPR